MESKSESKNIDLNWNQRIFFFWNRNRNQKFKNCWNHWLLPHESYYRSLGPRFCLKCNLSVKAGPYLLQIFAQHVDKTLMNSKFPTIALHHDQHKLSKTFSNSTPQTDIAWGYLSAGDWFELSYSTSLPMRVILMFSITGQEELRILAILYSSVADSWTISHPRSNWSACAVYVLFECLFWQNWSMKWGQFLLVILTS